jgi:hypothetical protein
MNNFVWTCNANGYEKFDNCSKLIYIMLCHYSKRWLLVSSSQIRARLRLSIHVKTTLIMLDVTTWDVLFYVQGKYLYLPKYCC